MKVTKVDLDSPVSPVITQALFRGYRCEAMYDNFSFPVHVELDHPFELIRRQYWEANHFHIGWSRLSHGRHNEKLSRVESYQPLNAIIELRLSEALDFIATCTPGHLKNQIPENTKTVVQIHQLVSDFLMDDSLGRQEFYHDAFKAITMMNFEKPPAVDINRIKTIRSKVPNDIIMMATFTEYKGKRNTNDLYGLYTFQCYNKTQLWNLIKTLDDYFAGYQIVEAYKDDEGYYYTGVYMNRLTHIDDIINHAFYDWFESVYQHSYDWMNQK